MILLAVSHFANEDPDEPEPAGKTAQNDVSDEVPESVSGLCCGHDGSFRRGHYKACKYRD